MCRPTLRLPNDATSPTRPFTLTRAPFAGTLRDVRASTEISPVPSSML